MVHISNTQKRLLCMYTFQQVGGRISKEQASTVLARTTPMTWFEAQETINALLGERLLEQREGSLKLSITTNGLSVVEIYAEQIPEKIRSSIEEYVKQNRDELAREIGVVATLKKQVNGYLVNLKLTEGSLTLMDVTLSAPNRKAAESICSKWKTRPVEKYSALLRIFSD